MSIPVPAPAPIQQPAPQQSQSPVPAQNQDSQSLNQSSESNSVSETNNVSSNAASLSSYQVNSNHESTYYRFSNGTTIPGTSAYFDLSVINDGWQWDRQRVVGSVGIRHTFGGEAKREALSSIRKDNLNRTLSICNSLGLFNHDSRSGIVIDYDSLPELNDCRYITRTTILPVPTPPKPEPTVTKRESSLEVQRLKTELAQMRILLERIQKEGSEFKLGG